MRIAEKVLILAVIVGIILTFSLVTEGQIITMFSLLTLGAIYFPLGFFLLNNIRLRDTIKGGTLVISPKTPNLIMGVVAGITLSIVCVGALFKLMNLPGSGEMLMMGSIGLIVISILVVALKSTNRNTVLTRTIPALVIGISFLFVSQVTLVRLQYRNHPAYVQAYERYLEDPKSEIRYQEMRLEFNRMRMTEEEFKEYEKAGN